MNFQGSVAKLKDLPRSTDGHHDASHFETGSSPKWLVLQGPFCWILLNHIREHDSKQAMAGNLQITDATVADLCHTLKTPWGSQGINMAAGWPS